VFAKSWEKEKVDGEKRKKTTVGVRKFRQTDVFFSLGPGKCFMETGLAHEDRGTTVTVVEGCSVKEKNEVGAEVEKGIATEAISTRLDSRGENQRAKRRRREAARPTKGALR